MGGGGGRKMDFGRGGGENLGLVFFFGPNFFLILMIAPLTALNNIVYKMQESPAIQILKNSRGKT